MKPKILVTGGGGQLGSVLIPALRKKWGANNVIASDLRPLDASFGLSAALDVLDQKGLENLIEKYQVNEIYHLAAILSAKGEQNPTFTWKINMDGLLNILEISRKMNIQKVFYPSTIAVFGSTTPKTDTPQNTILIPETVYGISKAAGEDWCNYYYDKYDLDVRSVRYPGLIGYGSLPGGGTTDYAVDIFHKGIKNQHYNCFLNKDTRLPMMYMQDAIRATIELMSAPKESIKSRTSYNLQGMSFSPEEIYAEIKKHIPELTIAYEPDFREKIARTWVETLDDSAARNDWGWKKEYDLPKMVGEMLTHLTV
ncbi:MAG: nucleoside-diphosphate-sugar epimerase [Maribacter sp.]